MQAEISQKAPIANLCYYEKLYLPLINHIYFSQRGKIQFTFYFQTHYQETSLDKYAVIKILSSDSFYTFLFFNTCLEYFVFSSFSSFIV